MYPSSEGNRAANVLLPQTEKSKHVGTCVWLAQKLPCFDNFPTLIAFITISLFAKHLRQVQKKHGNFFFKRPMDEAERVY